ncbi:MAG: TonB-dependent receptor, partial [Gammaproteobacteria bacterium]|nr:TonB-dependent receptor [Gammaproteobacteria bacterium]
IARVNELLQSQLLQPLNMTPVQPQLGEANLFILDSAGPSSVAFNEFNPLFNRNGLRIQGSGVVGGNDTWGQDVVVSGIQDRWSFSLGQYHFETEGFRENNDLEQDVLNALVQFQATERTSLLIEARRSERDQGDLTLLFDPDNYLPDLRQREDSDSLKLGLRHDLSARSTILALASAQSTDLFSGLPPFLSSDLEIDTYSGELQYLYQGDRWSLVTGIRYSSQDADEQTVISFPIPDPPFIIEDRVSDAYDADFLAAYLYGRIALTEQLDITLGVAAESLEGVSVDKDRVNPKFGLVWRPTDGTTVRLAAVETLQRRQFSRQDIQPSLEPTPVAGFNQFFDGNEGEEGRRYGLGVDQVLARDLSVGAEVSRRELKIPFDVFLPPPDFGVSREEADVDEDAGRAYLY